MAFFDPDEDRKLTFEAFVADEVGRELGPLAALGDPRDYLPPVGAARDYAADAEWQQHAAALIDRACCIMIVACEPSAPLAWELDHVRDAGAAERLFVVVGPWSLEGQVWSAFTAGLTDLGYNVFAGPPAPGAVLAFDRSARLHELATGAASPTDYIRPIARHVNRHLGRSRDRPAVAVPECDDDVR